MREVSAEQRRDCTEDSGCSKRLQAGSWIAIRGALRLPRRRGMSIECSCERLLVVLRTPGDDGVGGEPCGDERLVHAVSGERIDEPRRVPDEEHSASSRGRAELAHRQTVAAYVGDRGRDRRHGHARGGPDARAGEALPSASPRLRGSHDRPSGTPSRSRRERRRARPRPFRRTGCVRARSTARFPRARLRGRCPRRDRPTARRHRWRRRRRRGTRADRCDADACSHAGIADLDLAHGDSVAEVGPGGRRLLGEMEVEPSPLRHLDERLRARPRDLRSVPDADDHADRRRARRPDRRHTADAEARGPLALRRTACRAGTAPCRRGERATRPVRGGSPWPILPARHRRRARRNAPSRDRRTCRRAAATIARPAGVPEWPKGAGCKPAGSAFGGSNPPPCTVRRAESARADSARENP